MVILFWIDGVEIFFAEVVAGPFKVVEAERMRAGENRHVNKDKVKKTSQ